MKKILLSFFLLILLTSVPALAQDTAETTPDSDAADQTESDSRINRDDSLIFVGISPFGIHIPTLLSQPVSVGMYLGSSFLVAVEYGSLDFTLGDPDDDPVEGNYTNVGAYARWFPGTNSFNVLMGLHNRSLDVEYAYDLEVASAGKTYSVTSDVSYSAQVATVGIGNQWLMDFGLVLGLDWLVVSSVLSSSFEFGQPTLPGGVASDAKTQAEIEESEKDAQEVMDVVSSFPGILVFTIGFSF